HLLGHVGSATDEPRPERIRGWRRDEYGHGAGHRVSHLSGALYLDLEHDRGAGGQAALELRAQRSVAVARVCGVLDEVPGRDVRLELLVGHEVVVDAVTLAGPRLAGRGRDRQLDLG